MCMGCLFRLGPHTIIPPPSFLQNPSNNKFREPEQVSWVIFCAWYSRRDPYLFGGHAANGPATTLRRVPLDHQDPLSSSPWKLQQGDLVEIALCPDLSLSFLFYLFWTCFQVMFPSDVSKWCFQVMFPNDVDFDQSCPIFRDLCPETRCSGHKSPSYLGIRP